MAEYYVAWAEDDNPRDSWTEHPKWYRVWRSNIRGRDEAVTEPLTESEANEMLRKIKLLDPPAQKELDLKWR